MGSKNIISASFIFLLLINASSQFTWAGNGIERGGGDPIEQDFKLIGAEIQTALQGWQAQSLSFPAVTQVDLHAFADVLEDTHVFSTPHGDPKLNVIVNGKKIPREAVNEWRAHKIWVDQEYWDEISHDAIVSMSFAFHEYLGILQLDREYEISTSFRERLELERNVTLFKEALAPQFHDLSKGLDDDLKVQVDSVFARMETIQTTPDYQKCIVPIVDPKVHDKKHFAACLSVTAEVLQAAKMTPKEYHSDDERQQALAKSQKDAETFSSLAPWLGCSESNQDADEQNLCDKINAVAQAALMPQREVDHITQGNLAIQAYEKYVNQIQEPARKAFAQQLGQTLIDAHASSITAFMPTDEDMESQYNQACPGNLDQAMGCAFEKMFSIVNDQLKPLANQKELAFEQLIEKQEAALAGYQE